MGASKRRTKKPVSRQELELYIYQYLDQNLSDDPELNMLIRLYHHCQQTGLPLRAGGALDQPYLITAVIFPVIRRTIALKRLEEKTWLEASQA